MSHSVSKVANPVVNTAANTAVNTAVNPDRVSSAGPAIAGNVVTLRQLRVQLGTLTAAHYGWCPEASVSSLGAHVRHIIDHYYCFFRDLEGGVIDYDSRPKARRLETELSVAIDALQHYEQRLERLELNAEATLAVSGHTHSDGVPQRADTSVERELLFLQSHTLHHMAIIRLLLHQQGIDSPDAFGASPATLRSPMHSLDVVD